MQNISCEKCKKDFASKEALQMHTLAKHMTESEAQLWRESKKRQQGYRRWAVYGGLIVLLAGFVFFLITAYGGGTYSKGQIHWHAGLRITICGENVPLPQPKAGQIAHGQEFIGTLLMHLHAEPKIHIEGVVIETEEITLEKFAEAVGLAFTNTKLLDKKNGDICPDGKPGKVVLLVDGVESSELSNKVIADEEAYELKFR